MQLKNEIQEIIKEVFNDFKEFDFENHECLCDVFDINKFQLEDYEKRYKQQYYILRYMYAYSYEYQRLYLKVLENYINREKTGPTQNKIKVASIGCGNMVDYWSLDKVISTLRSQRNDNHDKELDQFPDDFNMRFFYKGYDIVNWSEYSFVEPRNSYKKFIQKDIIEAIDENLIDTDTDVFCFPKSIGEFDKDVIEKIANHIFATTEKRFLCFAIAYSNSLDNSTGIRNRKIIIDAANQKDFCAESTNIITGAQLEKEYGSVGIYDMPEIGAKHDYQREQADGINILDNISNLYEKCPNYQSDNCPYCTDKNKQADKCREKLRNPMLKINNINYEVITFTYEGIFE